MIVQFGFKQTIPRMQFNEKLFKKNVPNIEKIIFKYRYMYRYLLEITYCMYHITFSKFKPKALLFHWSLNTFVHKTEILQRGIFLNLLGD